MARARQQHLEGVQAPIVIPAVRKAAENYEEKRDEWMAKSGPVKEAKEKLVAAMTTANIVQYDEDDLHIKLKPGKPAVKVTRGDDDEDEE